MLLLTSLGSHAQNIDPKASTIEFTVTNLGIDVTGNFRAFSGTVQFDPAALEAARFSMRISAKSIRTGNNMRDEHLQEAEFFDVATHPSITFESEQVAATADGYTVTGTLNLKGTSKTIAIPFTTKEGMFTGSFTINRQDFNVGGDGFLDTIGDEVRIDLKCALQDEE